ncbi:MAG TPA: Rpp14/Pop5 family protein [archaeon]|jgi:RNase P/RNase MRP subunit POP5|nr:Rpp14/Pop5 family protein [archaeon]HRT02394.1 Rpp14/Pop5 family protein [Candidatus Diapherotrites archaeon]
MLKKKIGVIKPTMRQKKRYIKLKVYAQQITQDKYKLENTFKKNLQKIYGLFVDVDTNLKIIEINEKNEIIIRINKTYLNQFISSLLFLNKEIGIIKIQKISNTLKKQKQFTK